MNSTSNLLEPLETRRLFSGGGAAYAFRTIAALGASLPNASDGVFTSDFEPGVLNERGQLVFTSEQGTAAGDQGEGAFLTGPGGSGPIRALSLPGQSAPGGGGAFGGFGTWSRDALNNRGDAAFAATLVAPGVQSYNGGVYRYSYQTGQVTAVVVPGVTDAPTGGKFLGTLFRPSLNDRGVLTFVGIVPSDAGFAHNGVGEAIFAVEPSGHIIKLVAPGDPAPGSSTFDSFQDTSINERGDVAFGAHVAGDPALGTDIFNLGAFQSAYLRRADGTIISVAHQGQAIPASAGADGVFDTAYSPVVNDERQVAFLADIGTQPGNTNTDQDKAGVFLYDHGRLVAAARPGQAMPGGGVMQSASKTGEQVYLNNAGQVVFAATLTDGGEGVYAYQNGTLRMVARTGTVLPGVGTVTSLEQFGNGDPSVWAANNDRGQVAFSAVVTDAAGEANTLLLLATPTNQSDNRGDFPRGTDLEDKGLQADQGKDRGHDLHDLISGFSWRD